jgi:hypothetical protein
LCIDFEKDLKKRSLPTSAAGSIVHSNTSTPVPVSARAHQNAENQFILFSVLTASDSDK